MSPYKIVHGYIDDDPVLQQLIFEGVNEMVQDATYPSTKLEVMVRDMDRVIYVVNQTDGDIVGVLCYHVADKAAHITLLYVEPSSRMQHLAKSMMSLLDARLAEAGVFRKSTSVHATNGVAVKVLGKLGFSNEVIRMDATLPPA